MLGSVQKSHLVQYSVHTVADQLLTRNPRAGHGATAPSRPCSPAAGVYRIIPSDTGASTWASGLVAVDSLLFQEFV